MSYDDGRTFIDWQSRERDLARLEARRLWSAGMPVTFIQPGVRELIEGDKFHEIDWTSLAPQQEAIIKATEFTLNGVRRRVRVIGWQGSESGAIDLHGEQNDQEEAHLAAGHIVMTIVDREGKYRIQEAWGALPINALEQVTFALRVCEGETEGQEHLALSVLANIRVDVPRFTTEQGMSHATVIPSASKYLIVKHQPVAIPD